MAEIIVNQGEQNIILDVFYNRAEAPLKNHSELILDDGTNPHGITKTDLFLGNVDNTSDVDKAVSDATLTALDGKVDDSQVLTNVPVGALFTDTIYDDANILLVISGKQDKTITYVITHTGNYLQEYNNSLLIIEADVTLTIPTGLSNDFDCVVRINGNYVLTNTAGAGVTLLSGSGTTLEDGKRQSVIKHPNSESYFIDGENS